MKRAAVGICLVGVFACGAGVWTYAAQRKVRLPVYAQPVSFFEEARQSIHVGPLPRGIRTLSAQACAGCHRDQHSQWQASAHSRSVTEPVFAAAFKAEPRFLCRSCHSPLNEQHPNLAIRLQGRPRLILNGEPLPPAHPEIMQGAGTGPCVVEPNRKYDAALANEGVTCVTCHVRDGNVLTSSRTARADVPHALAYSPMLSKSEFCGGCHQFNIERPGRHPFEAKPIVATAAIRAQVAGLEQVLAFTSKQQAVAAAGGKSELVARRQENLQARIAALRSELRTASAQRQNTQTEPAPDDPPVPPDPGLESQYQEEARVQDTLDEFHASPAAARGESCQSCHMPAAQQGHGHLWAGRNDLTKLREAVTMEARLDRTAYQPGQKLQAVIKLKNHAGHRFPTGDSLHAGILDVWLQDGNRTLGREVFLMARQSDSSPFLQLARTSAAFGDAIQRPVAVTQAPQQALTSRAPRPSVIDVDRVTTGSRMEAPQRADTRLLAGEETTVLYTQPVRKEWASARNPVLRVRVFHAAVHPGFRGSRIDSGKQSMTLVRETVLPVRIAPTTVEGAQASAAVIRPRG